MNSIFKLSKLQRMKLKEMIRTLFPEYESIFVKFNGIIILRKYWYSCTWKSIHVSELCITELPERLSKFKKNSNEHVPIYNIWLNHIIHNNICNVINWLYIEFLKIKHESIYCCRYDSSLLSENDPKFETIGDILKRSKIKKLTPKYRVRTKKIRSIQKMYESLLNDSIINKFSKTNFIIA
jgi:hypothetical protein